MLDNHSIYNQFKTKEISHQFNKTVKQEHALSIHAWIASIFSFSRKHSCTPDDQPHSGIKGQPQTMQHKLP